MNTDLFEAKETYYIANIDGSFLAVNGTKLSNGLFAYKHELPYLCYVITDIDSGLLLANRIRTLKDCKTFVDTMSDKAKQSLENIRHGEKYLDLCKKLAKFKADQKDK